jgi:uncharacterized membrane protein YphA (DoxX/SURF4 family)
MIGHSELTLRWILGLQLIFWGLNGFFHWKPIPPSAKVIDDFTAACMESRFIMPVVKVFEILFGIFLLANYAVPLALALLSPIVFVITGLHALHNKKFWEVLVPISLPFIILVALHYEAWLNLLD